MKLEITPALLIKAYALGVFPMGHEDKGREEISWYAPDPRCVIDLDEFHATKRLRRTYRRGTFRCAINTAWDQVIQLCAQRHSTWITPKIIRAYTDLHRQGYAHSIEVYKDTELVGGLYGVSLGGAFMGESMFHRRTDASKIALLYLVEKMKQKGFILLDCQFITDHLKQFGAREISQNEYLERLGKALQLDCCLL